MLPAQRIEWYLAQIAYMVAAGNGSKASFADFLLDTTKDDDTDDELETAKKVFDFKPRKRRA